MKVLDRELVRHNLTVAGLYLAAYELLMGSIVQQLKRSFVGIGSEDGAERYAADVLSRHKEALMASCLWLKEMGALSDQDLEAVGEIRRHRNEIAHELPNFVVDEARDLKVADLPRMRELLRKIDTWWILEVEVPTNPDFDGKVIGPEDVASGPVLLLDHLISAVSEIRGVPKS